MKFGKFALKLPPCPYYDIPGIESWLGEMAQKGWRLNRFRLGFACFEQAQPQRLTYRLEAKQQADSPTPESLELTAAYGWRYVTTRNVFHIYRCADAQPREMNTDPAVQAIAMGAARRSAVSQLAGTLLYVLLFLCCLTFGSHFAPLSAILEFGAWFLLLTLALITLALCRALPAAVRLTRLCRSLKQGVPMEHRADWQRRAVLHQWGAIVLAGLTILWFALALTAPARLEADKIPLSEFDGAVPFATLGDYQLNASDSWTLDSNLDSTVSVRSDPLAPAVIHWREYTEHTLDNGSAVAGVYLVDYYETRAAWLAQGLATENLRSARRESSFELIPLPDLGVDYARAYYNFLGFPTVVLHNGDRCVIASLHQYAASDIAVEEWARILAESIM